MISFVFICQVFFNLPKNWLDPVPKNRPKHFRFLSRLIIKTIDSALYNFVKKKNNKHQTEYQPIF
jgi:hypothetical protein